MYIRDFTNSLNNIISTSIGPQYVGKIKYWMTEWDAGSPSTYNRDMSYVSTLFIVKIKYWMTEWTLEAQALTIEICLM